MASASSINNLGNNTLGKQLHRLQTGAYVIKLVPCRRLQLFCTEHQLTGHSETREQRTGLEHSA